MSENHDKAPAGGSNFLLGAIIGAALTYLFATKSGQKIKNELIKDLSDVLESIGEEIEAAEGEPRPEGRESAKIELESAKEEVQKKVEQVAEEIREVPQQIEKIQKKGRHFFFRKRHRQQES